MIYASIAPTWNREALEAFLLYLATGSVNPLVLTPKLRLLKASVVVNRDTLLADLIAQEADFSGYPAGGATPGALSAAVNLGTNAVGLLSHTTFIEADPATTTNVIYGYFYESSGVDLSPTPDWLLAEIFPTPMALGFAGDFLDLLVYFPMVAKVVI